MSTIWIVVPCYRDVPSFRELRSHVRDVVANTPRVDDSTIRYLVLDDTAGLDPEIDGLRGLPDVEVLQPPFNLGHQRGLVYAVRTLADDLGPDDVVVTLDADGEDRPEDLPRLLEPVLSSPPAARVVALASRMNRKESLGFKVGYRLFKAMFRLLTGTVIKSGNFAAYRSMVARRTLRHPHFDLCYSSSFVSLDSPIVYVPCDRGERYEGRSRMNRTRLIQHGLRMVMPFLDRVAVRALVFFTGICSASLAVLVTLVIAAAFASPPTWSYEVAAGLMALSLGALASFLLAFTLYAQSRGMSLSGLELVTARDLVREPTTEDVARDHTRRVFTGGDASLAEPSR